MRSRPATLVGMSDPLVPPARLLNGSSARFRVAAYVGLCSLVAMAILAALAVGTGRPFLFPSLGPTAFLLFFAPMAAASSPKHVLAGHTVGVVCGVISLVVFGLWGLNGGLDDIDWRRGAAATVCVALTATAKIWLGVPHAPALATTLIVGLGLMHTPLDLTILLLSIALLTVIAWAMNRMAGYDYPLWSPRRQHIPRRHDAEAEEHV